MHEPTRTPSYENALNSCVEMLRCYENPLESLRHTSEPVEYNFTALFASVPSHILFRLDAMIGMASQLFGVDVRDVLADVMEKIAEGKS